MSADLAQVDEVLGHAVADGRVVTVTFLSGAAMTGTVHDHPTDPDAYTLADVDGPFLGRFYVDDLRDVVNE